jgi:hypothetical protein
VDLWASPHDSNPRRRRRRVPTRERSARAPRGAPHVVLRRAAGPKQGQ